MKIYHVVLGELAAPQLYTSERVGTDDHFQKARLIRIMSSSLQVHYPSPYMFGVRRFPGHNIVKERRARYNWSKALKQNQDIGSLEM